MKKPEVQSDWIDRYHENALNQSELKRFSGLYELSGVLRAEVEVDRCLNELLTDQDTLDFYQKINSVSRKQFSTNRRGFLLLMAASFLILFTVGTLLYLLMKFNPAAETLKNPAPLVQKTESSGPAIPESYPEMAIAGKPSQISGDEFLLSYPPISCFEVLPELELLVGAHTRTSTFKLIAPIPDQQMAIGSVVVFIWEYIGSALPVTVSILNNRGQSIYKTPSIEGNSYLLDTGDFQKGLYYWKITMEDELIMLGKIKLN